MTGTATLRGGTSGQVTSFQLSGNVAGQQLDFSFSYIYPPNGRVMVNVGTANVTDNAMTGNAMENYNGGYNCSYFFTLTKQ